MSKAREGSGAGAARWVPDHGEMALAFGPAGGFSCAFGGFASVCVLRVSLVVGG